MAQADTQTSDKQLYLDDLVVGQRFTSRAHVVDAHLRVNSIRSRFTSMRRRPSASFSENLLPVDWHAAAITMRLPVETGLPLAGGIIGAGGEVSWPKPTRPGDTLTVTSEIEEITPSRSRPDRGTLKVRSETRNQRDEIVQVLLARLIVPRRVARA
jgi:hypothetical protein